MPAEKTSREQAVNNSFYHNRNQTLKQLALSNLIQRHFTDDDVPLPGNTTFKAIAGGTIALPVGPFIPEEKTVNVVCIVGYDDTTPKAIALISFSDGEVFGGLSADGGFTAEFYSVAIEDNVLLIGGYEAEIQKLNLSSGALERKNTGGSDYITCFKKGGGVWLAGGNDGLLLKSTNNGNSWIDKSLSSTPDILSLAYGKGRFVTVDEDQAFYSTDLGESWAEITVPPPPGIVAFEFGKIIFDGKQFLVACLCADGSFYYPYIAKSENGTAWTFEPLPNVTGEEISLSIAYSEEEDIYVVVGVADYPGNPVSPMWCSYDGAKTWERKYTPLFEAEEIHAIAYAARSFHFIGEAPREYGSPRPAYYHSQKLY